MAKDIKKHEFIKLLPIFIVAVSLVFSITFIVLLLPLAQLGNLNANIVFIALLIVTTTVASTVSLLFYLFLVKNKK